MLAPARHKKKKQAHRAGACFAQTLGSAVNSALANPSDLKQPHRQRQQQHKTSWRNREAVARRDNLVGTRDNPVPPPPSEHPNPH